MTAWAALGDAAAFQDNAAAARDARAFLETFSPAALTPDGREQVRRLGARYLSVLQAAYVSAGTPSDLPSLDRLASEPAFLGRESDPEFRESIRETARVCSDAIRLRSGP
jgi:broad specificity phosphatase PhoE